jgi:hypothetical protein
MKAKPELLTAYLILGCLYAPAWGAESMGQSEDPAKQPTVQAEPDWHVSAADRRAREVVLALIQSPENEHYRNLYRLTVPDKPTELPFDYDVEIWGYTVCFGSPELMRIRIRGGRASGEWFDRSGVYYGKVPGREIDDRLRQMVYFHLAAEERVRTEPFAVGISGSSPASYVIRVVSDDPTHPFRLQTKGYEVYPDPDGKLSLSALEVWNRCRRPNYCAPLARQFGHNRVIMALQDSRAENLEPDEPSEGTQKEVLSWLRRGRREAEPPTVPFKIGRRAVLLELALPLAIQWGLESGVEILRSRGMKTEAAKLEIAFSDHPADLLKAALTSSDDDLRDWATSFVIDHVSATVAQEVLGDVLPQIGDRSTLTVILDYFKQRPSNAAMQSAVDSIYSAKTSARDLRIGAAEYLLWQTKEDEYYDALVAEALKFVDAPASWITPEYYAARAVMRFSFESGLKRRETGVMARTLLGRISKDKYESGGAARGFVVYLASLHEVADLELLRAFLGHEDKSFVATVIWAMAAIQPEAAIDAARQEVAKAVASENKEWAFRWQVAPYMDLFFWQEDRASVEAIERVVQSLGDRQMEEDQYKIQAKIQAERLVRCLRARGIDDRVRSAAEYAEGCRLSNRLRREIADRLIREGGDPKRCAVLTEERNDLFSVDSLSL